LGWGLGFGFRGQCRGCFDSGQAKLPVLDTVGTGVKFFMALDAIEIETHAMVCLKIGEGGMYLKMRTFNK
jgi:hypothetical protein